MDDLQTRLQVALGDAYHVERELGGGGMSRVFIAGEPALSRRVVIKVLPPEMAAGVSAERFRREIQLAASLQHPHIVPVLTAGRAGDLFYYVMPLVEGESLRDRLLRTGSLPVREAVGILDDVADALAYAHQRGLVHRDIKPDNVLCSGGHAMVTDFGVAKALGQTTGADGSLTAVGTVIGTPAYMAPEQAGGDPAVDHRADIYAVGVLGYEMLTGRLPFDGRSLHQVLAAQLTQHPQPPGELVPGLPVALDQLLVRCLARDPGDRPASAAALRPVFAAALTPGAAVRARKPLGAEQRRWRAVVGALVAVAAIVTAAVFWQAVRPTEAVAGSVIAVMPFTVRGGGDLAYLSEGMVNLLSTSLDGAGDLRSADPRALLGFVRREGVSPVDPDAGRRIAARLGARYYVLGDIVQAGDSVRVDAALYTRDRREPLGSPATVSGGTGQVFGLVDELAARLLANRGVGPAARVTRIAAVTTASLPALKDYLEGEGHFRAGRFAAAVESFTRAVAADTMFALAYYRLSVAAEWALRPDRAEAAAQQAVVHAARLSTHDRDLLEALLAAREGDAVEAERRYRAILALHPDDVEAWIQLGEVLFHEGRLWGRPLQEARAPFERVVGFEPEQATALIHLARLAADRHDTVAADTLAQRVSQLNPGGERLLEMETLRAALAGDSTRWRAVLALLDQGDENGVAQSWFTSLVYGDDFAGTLLLMRHAAAASRSPDITALAQIALALVPAIQGRWREALAALPAPGQPERADLLVTRAYLMTAPQFPVPREALLALRRTLESWDAAAERPSPIPNAYFNIHDGQYPVLRHYLLGLVAQRLGQMDDLGRRAAQIERFRGDPAAMDLARRLGLGLRARLAYAQGRPVEAIDLLTPVIRGGGYEPKLFSPFHGSVMDRYFVGALLDSLGGERAAMARDWLSSFDRFAYYDFVMEAPAQWLLARQFDRLGLADSAVAHYSRFVFLWADCEPDLRPLVDQAQARLRALRKGDD